MANIRLRDIEGYENFKAECEFFRCEDEYPGWTGTEKYIIISEMTEEVLVAKYPLITEAMRPFMVIGKSYGDIRRESNNAERRIKHFTINHETIFDYDEETECCNDELIDYKTSEKMSISLEMEEALKTLTDIQQKRVRAYYFEKMTIDEIVRMEGVNSRAVRKSLQQSLVKLKKYFS